MLEKMPAVVGHALSGVRAGMEKLSYAEFSVPEAVVITSDAFRDGESIPSRFTDDGAKISPPLRFESVPSASISLALIVEDADSPTPAPLCHALVWNIDPESGGGFHEGALDADATALARVGARFGKNSFLSQGWLPPDPPSGHGPHRYAFQLFALDRVVDLAEGSGRSALIEAMRGGVIARGLLVGTYERS